MKHSIKRKIINTAVLNFLCLTALMVLVSIFCISDVLDDDSSEIMQLKCSESAREINEELRNIEQSVNTMSSLFASSLGEHDELLMNKNRFDIYMKLMRELGKNAVENTHGALGVYLRFNPSVTDNGSFFWVRDGVTGTVVDTPLTDIEQYDKDDLGHVGWYYTPLAEHQPVWLDPYHNENIGYDMISYVVPLYRSNGEPLGIIGMDIDITLISELCAKVRVYDSGDAFVIDQNGCLINGKGHFMEGYGSEYGSLNYDIVSGKVITAKSSGKKVLVMSQVLDNNMKFFIRVPQNEINAPKRRLITLLLVIAGGFIVISAFVIFRWAGSFTRPLLELTKKAKIIADGELETDLSCKTGDEVELLSESLGKMVGSLKEHIDYINSLALIDPKTKLGNSLAYRNKTEELEADIADGQADFTIFVMDLNNLKKVNDTYGHEKGDVYITNSAAVISRVFGEENCFRIGGDEFTAVFEGIGEDEINSLLEKLEEELTGFNIDKEEIYDQVHISIGVSSYISGEDYEPADVFRRADSAMYEDKKRQKACRE